MREFPGGPVDRTWHFHCCGLGSIPGQELRYLKVHSMAKKKKKKIKETGAYTLLDLGGKNPLIYLFLY